MKITLSMNEVLERLYAITALHGYVNETTTARAGHILSPAQAPALQVAVKSAFGTALSYLMFSGWEADISLGQLGAQAPDDIGLDSATAAERLAQAVVGLTLYAVYSGGVDSRANAAYAQAVEALQSLSAECYRPMRLAASYL